MTIFSNYIKTKNIELDFLPFGSFTGLNNVYDSNNIHIFFMFHNNHSQDNLANIAWQFYKIIFFIYLFVSFLLFNCFSLVFICLNLVLFFHQFLNFFQFFDFRVFFTMTSNLLLPIAFLLTKSLLWCSFFEIRFYSVYFSLVYYYLNLHLTSLISSHFYIIFIVFNNFSIIIFFMMSSSSIYIFSTDRPSKWNDITSKMNSSISVQIVSRYSGDLREICPKKKLQCGCKERGIEKNSVP